MVKEHDFEGLSPLLQVVSSNGSSTRLEQKDSATEDSSPKKASLPTKSTNASACSLCCPSSDVLRMHRQPSTHTRVSMVGGGAPSPLSIGPTVRLFSGSVKTETETLEEDVAPPCQMHHHIICESHRVVSSPGKVVCEAVDPSTGGSTAGHLLVFDNNEVESLTRFTHRLLWLIILLFVQSISSSILKAFERLIIERPVVVFFLTMLVGAGGNAGSQSTVLAIRAITRKELQTTVEILSFVKEQMLTGLKLAFILGSVSFLRVWLFDGDVWEVLAICASMFSIVFVSVIMGTFLPVLLRYLGSDPAHAGAAIQVTMDIIGVTITCVVSTVLLLHICPAHKQQHKILHSRSVVPDLVVVDQ